MNNTDDKIGHARSLLKKFQSKQRRSSLTGSSEASSTAAANFHLGSNVQGTPTDGMNRNSFSGEHSRASSRASSIAMNHQNNGGELLVVVDNQQPLQPMDRCHSVPKNFNAENAELLTLRTSFGQKQQELNEALSKLQALHKHYAELHSAYSQLSAEQSAQKNSAASAYAEQIHQLRTTLAVALDEKNALQAELRELKSSLQHQSIQIQSSPSSSEYNPAIYELESRLSKMTAERDHLTETVAKQSAQIEHQRRECSGFEAKLVLIQQDRIDSQARIKSLYAEKTQLEQTLDQQRNDLAMRDIYIRQLARHAGVDQPKLGHSGINDVNATEEVRKRLEEELERHKSEASEMRKQLQTLREQHQMAMAELSSKVQRLEAELQQLRSAKAEMDSSNTFLEEQLRILRLQLEATNVRSKQSDEVSPPERIDPVEHATLKQSVTKLHEDKERMMEELRGLGQALEEKNRSIDALNQSLQEAQVRIINMEQQENIQSTMNTDVALLSDQLQNEKATVSRAVGQNIELKARLTELQDRLVQVINDSAAKEDERLSALAAVDRLTQELESAKQQIMMVKNECEQIKENEDNISKMTQSDEHPHPRPDFSDQAQQTDEEGGEVSSVRSFATLTDNAKAPTTWTSSNNNVGVQTDEEEEERGRTVTTDAQHSSSAYSQEFEQTHHPHHQQHHCVNATDSDVSSESALNQRLEALSEENQRYRANNERLEYWLTALESENESIGEYIALYRFQRCQIQHRIAEKEAALAQLQEQNSQLMAQLVELHNSIMAFLETNNGNAIGQNVAATQPTITEEESKGDEHREAGSNQPVPPSSVEETAMDRLLRALKKSKILGTKATCEAAKQAQIHCSGCVECRGEMCTL